MKTKKEVKETILVKDAIVKPLTSEITDIGFYARRVAVGPLPDGPYTWWYPDINGLVDFTLLPPNPDADPPFPGTKALDIGAFIKSMRFPVAPTRIYYAQTQKFNSATPDEMVDGLIDFYDSLNYTIDNGMYCKHLRAASLAAFTDPTIDGTLYITALPG